MICIYEVIIWARVHSSYFKNILLDWNSIGKHWVSLKTLMHACFIVARLFVITEIHCHFNIIFLFLFVVTYCIVVALFILNVLNTETCDYQLLFYSYVTVSIHFVIIFLLEWCCYLISCCFAQLRQNGLITTLKITKNVNWARE